MQVASQGYVLGLFSSSGGGLLGGSNGSQNNTITPIDVTALAVQAQTPVSASSLAALTAAKPPPAPWAKAETSKQAQANVQNALVGGAIINSNVALTGAATSKSAGAQSTLKGLDQDYQRLFELYRGLNTLMDVANQASTKNLPATDLKQLAKAFSDGLGQVSSFIADTRFTNLRLAQGTDSTASMSKLTVASTTSATSYATPPMTSSLSADVPAYDGNVKFDIAIKRGPSTFNIPIDLAGMGSDTRSLANVINYVNSQLAASGVSTRFATNRFPAQPTTVTVNKQTVTLAAGVDHYGMKINVGASETVSFSAPQTAGAIYLSQTMGDPDPDHNPTTNDGVTQSQLLKFQTDTVNVPSPLQKAGQANWVDGRVFANTLDPNIKTVRATQVGPDGSVYMIADINGPVDGKGIQGSQDVALLKYDSTGKEIYSRTLGAADTATGLGLAVSANGQVAVTGKLTGALRGTVDGPINSGATGDYAANSDSFVSVFSSSGDQVWTERRGARLNDEATAATFAPDGTLYVTGRAQGQMPTAGAPQGGYDGYIEAFKTSAAGKPAVTFTQTFGGSGDDKPKGIVVDGTNLVTASVENGHAVLRTFDISSGSPVQTATRDLGDLQGGDIAGLALNGAGKIVVAGTTGNPSLSAGAVTRASSGGSDAFAAQLSTDLSNQPTDAIAYYGGTGDDRATSLAVSNGKVFIAGVAGTDLPGQAPVGKQDGFLAQLDIATGSIVSSERFTGKDGIATPLSIAAAPTGASILDQLNLPSGTLQLTDSQQLTSQSSLRAGDQFTITAGGGVAAKVTIDANETFDTLAQKINRASEFQATATVAKSLDGKLSLKIVPTYGSLVVQIGAGPQGKDALPSLGLSEGDVNLTTTANGVTRPADGGATIYGLGISSNLNLNDSGQISHAKAQLSSALSVVSKIYQDLVKASAPKSAQNVGKTGTQAPAYMQAELANLKAGLARLTAGSGSTTSTTA